MKTTELKSLIKEAVREARNRRSFGAAAVVEPDGEDDPDSKVESVHDKVNPE